MGKKIWLFVLNIGAFLFLLFSLWGILGNITDFLNITVPGLILFGTHLYTLWKT